MNDLLNRPMLESDLASVARDPRAEQLRAMVRDYRQSALPVMNGGFNYSNMAEGDDQMLTCNPYRLWEYTSLFLRADVAPGRRVLDVGGAASPLPYFLAENGFDVTAIDLQPLLVAICNHVAAARSLPLTAAVADATTIQPDLNGRFDVVTCISVLEHIPAPKRRCVFETVFAALRPGGLFFLTFDYGDYAESDTYSDQGRNEVSRSIGDAGEIASALDACGFRFIGNDPRALDPDIKKMTASPSARAITARYSLNRTVDGATPWSAVLKYFVRRLLHVGGVGRSRFLQHNFFRMFVEKPR